MKNFFKNILVFSLIMIVSIPVFVNAAPIIPCGGPEYNDKGEATGQQLPPCDFNMLMKLVNNVINWIILISVPVAAGVFAWAGIKYMTTGISDQKSEAKKMLGKVFWGFVFILAAWIIVGTIIKALLKNPESVPVDIGINKSVNIYI